MNTHKTALDETLLPHRNFNIEGRQICFYREVSSTNRVAQALAKQGGTDGLVVMSSYQSAGVGRMQRPWICPPGRALTMSMIVKPQDGSSFAPQFMLLCGVAVAEAVRELTGADAGIKWPNDVLVDGKKVCGILAQSYAPKDEPGFAVVGVGINVRQTKEELPEDCRDTSSSLSIEAGRRLSRTEVLRCFLKIWDRHYAAFREQGYPYIREKWIENNITLGRKITLHGEPEKEGVAVDVSENGGLLVRLSGGEIKELLSEEFTLGKAYYRREGAEAGEQKYLFNSLPSTPLSVKEMMNGNFRTIRPADTLRTVIEAYQEFKINILPVVDETDKLIGVFPKKRLYKALLSGASIDAPCEAYIVDDPIYLTEDLTYNESSLVLRIARSSVDNVVVLNKDGKVVGVIGTAEYLRASTDVILTSSAMLESMFRVNHEGIILVDKGDCILRINPAAERMFRLNVTEVQGRPLREVLPEIAAGPGQTIDFRRTVRSLPVLVSRVPIVENGEQIGSSYAFLDNSDIERIANELAIVRRMQTTIDMVINASSDGVFVSDMQGVIHYVNEKARDLLGESAEHIIGKTVRELLHTNSLAKLIASGKPIVDSLNINGKRSIVSHISYISEDSGGMSGIVSTVYLNDSTVTEELARQWFDMSQQIQYYRSELEKHGGSVSRFDQIVTKNPAFTQIKEDAQRIARSSSTVLLTGESGVGKSMFARGIHESSPRAKQPFVIVNCVSIPESLFESELFGYAPGAFTGASKTGKSGYFERADKGTIFMDEIGDIPLSIQAKLLQVLQDKEFERVGGTSKQTVDVRIIAATNRDLREMIADKIFREDLYYRLNVIEFHLPPLRDRREDVIPLAEAFVDKYNRLLGARITGISEDAQRCLTAYAWQGNIRELENAIEHAANYVWDGEIDAENLPVQIGENQGKQGDGSAGWKQGDGSAAFSSRDAGRTEFGPAPDAAEYRNARDEFERELLEDALRQTGGNKSAAARLMHLSRSAFYERLEKYGLKNC